MRRWLVERGKKAACDRGEDERRECGHMFPLSADVSKGVNVQADYFNVNSVPLL